MKKSDLRNIIKEEIRNIVEGDEQVTTSYNKIISVINQESRILNDDDAFELHERLKNYFNRTF
jgi:ribosomal protein S20